MDLTHHASVDERFHKSRDERRDVVLTNFGLVSRHLQSHSDLYIIELPLQFALL